MKVALLINGQPPADRAHAVAFDDRGLQYGDGLFETALLTGGRIRFLEDHLARLESGCQRLQFACPERATLLRELAMLVAGQGEGILKIVVTRGSGGRGYRARQADPLRILALYPPLAGAPAPQAITVRWCEMRLGRNPVLAGLKHLNRLEQVLAQAEWSEPGIDEGLMLDTEGELVAATAGNVFLVQDGTLATPDLRYCGIHGVMRGRVIAAARALSLPVEEHPLWRTDLDAADEVFITNALCGIRPVTALEDHVWPVGGVTRRLAATLGLW